MKASELIKAGVKVGDKLYYCLRTTVEEFEVFHINEDKDLILVYSEDNGSCTISNYIDDGFELTRHAAWRKRVESLRAWLSDLEELESKL